jgi:glycosyltransferase involved in cell wall biosynthesis
MDSTALARAIIDLIENQEKARLLGERARKKVEQHFDERVMLEQTLALYKTQIEAAALPSSRSFRP